MSRSHLWYWELRSGSADLAQARETWERFFWDCPLPVKYIPSGACAPDCVSVLLYANRAKARRLAIYLDSYFDQVGALSIVIMDDPE